MGIFFYNKTEGMAHKATFNGVVVAESDKVERVEGNLYFPHDSLKKEFFSKTDHSTVCGWKGTAHYYTVSDGKGGEKVNGAWYYPQAKDGAKNIENYVAFYPQIKTQ